MSTKLHKADTNSSVSIINDGSKGAGIVFRKKKNIHSYFSIKCASNVGCQIIHHIHSEYTDTLLGTLVCRENQGLLCVGIHFQTRLENTDEEMLPCSQLF